MRRLDHDVTRFIFLARKRGVMPVHSLRLSPETVIRLIKAEIKEAGGQPELYVSAHRDYRIEEYFDRAAYGLANDNQHDLVSEEAVLSVEPRVEQNYWILSIVAHKKIGPRVIGPENALSGVPLSIAEFCSTFVDPGTYKINVQLAADTPQAHEHFDRWWAELKARHRASGRRVRAGSGRKTHRAYKPACAPQIDKTRRIMTYMKLLLKSFKTSLGV